MRPPDAEQIITLIAHDIAAELRHIGIRAEIAGEEAGATAAIREHATAIRSQTDRLTRMVSGARRYALIQARVPRRDGIDLTALIAQALKLRADDLRRFETRTSGAGRVVGDEVMLALALDALLDNAALHGAPGGGRLSLRIETGTSGVGDDGDARGGVALIVDSPGDRRSDPTLLGALTRAEGAPRGLGLGLALVAGVMARHDGTAEAMGADAEGFGIALRFPPARLPG